MLRNLRRAAVWCLLRVEDLILFAARPVNALLVRVYRSKAVPGSVLHLSGMVHIPWLTCRVLREHGMKADYMALNRSSVWNDCDYLVEYSKWPPLRALQQLRWFWAVVARYEIVHSHFMMTLTPTAWELPLLKAMGRGLVVNFRGCDVRDREMNMRLHPDVNICQECDYWISERQMFACRQPELETQRRWAREYGDLFLVTTPDMLEFWPDAVHFTFFAPEVPVPDPPRTTSRGRDGVVKIVHATNHPGIEGTRFIQQAVAGLKAEGHDVELRVLSGVSYTTVLDELKDADLSIGKLKMGYYANAQIESMMHGVPTVTHVREEFMTPELAESGFILTCLSDLERTLEHYLTHPEELEHKRAVARSSIERIHDNDRLAARLAALYVQVMERKSGRGDSRRWEPGERASA